MPPRKVKFRETLEITIKVNNHKQIVSFLTGYLINDICRIVGEYLEISKYVEFCRPLTQFFDHFYIEHFIFIYDKTSQFSKYYIRNESITSPIFTFHSLTKNKYRTLQSDDLDERYINFVLNHYNKTILTTSVVYRDKIVYKIIPKYEFMCGTVVKDGLIILSFDERDQKSTVIVMKKPEIFLEAVKVFKKLIRNMIFQ